MRKKSLEDWIFDICNFLFLSFFVLLTIYPIINTLAVSFNDGLDALRGGIYLWPRKFSTDNYLTVLRRQNLMTGVKITILRTVVATVLQLIVTALLAYVLSIRDFVFKKQISFIYVMTMYVNGGLIPVFLLYKGLGLTNSFWVYIIPGAVSAFNMLVLRTYMVGLPDSLIESAQLDGANHLVIFWKIIAPLCKPVFATIALFIAVWQWNSWFDVMLYNRMSDELTTIQYELMKLLSSVTNTSATAESMKNATGKVTPTSVRAAATIITAAPIVCLYPFLQRYFITGLTIGGVKE